MKNIYFKIGIPFQFILLICNGISSSSNLYKNCKLGEAILYNEGCIQCIQHSSEDDHLNNLRNMDDDKQTKRWIRCPFISLTSSDDFDRMNIALGAKFLNGRNLRVVTIERQPFVKIKNGKNFSGVCFELFYTLQEKYNFSREIFLPDDGNWGAELPNGTWNGMVGIVYSKKADMGIAGFSVTYERSRVVAFTMSFHQEPTGILIPPPTEGEKLSVLIRPLSAEVWFSVGFTIVILAPTLYVMDILSQRIRGENNKKIDSFDIMTQLFHFLIGSLVQESVISPVKKSGRFLIILWWMTTIVLSNIYVAYLVSYLSAPRLFNVVNSLEDLVNQHDIKWTFRKSSALESLFKSSSSVGVYKSIGNRVAGADLVTTDYEGAQKALTGRYAFIKEKSFLDVALGEDFQKTHICRITVAKQTFFKVETALITQKQSVLLAVFNNGIGWAVSTGLMEKWKTIHWPRDLWCEDAATYISNTSPKTRKLSLVDLQGTFFLLGAGVIFSICSFMIEKITNIVTLFCIKRI